jgi:regulator of replication initiation timing
MTCELCGKEVHADWCPTGLLIENAELKQQVEELTSDNTTLQAANEHLKTTFAVSPAFEKEVMEWWQKERPELFNKLAAREAELAGMTKARDTFYNDMLLYKKAADDLIEFREVLFGAIKKRDGQIKNLKDCIDDDRFDFNVAQEAKDARIAELAEALEANKARLEFLSSNEAKYYSQDNSYWIDFARKALSGKESGDESTD